MHSEPCMPSMQIEPCIGYMFMGCACLSLNVAKCWVSVLLCSNGTGHRQHLLANVMYIVYFLFISSGEVIHHDDDHSDERDGEMERCTSQTEELWRKQFGKRPFMQVKARGATHPESVRPR